METAGKTAVGLSSRAAEEVLEWRKQVDYSRDANAAKARKHPAISQDTDIIERRLNSREHIVNCGFGLVHRGHPSNLSYRGMGAGEVAA